MHQYQVVVETGGARLFETNWVTGRESAQALVMAIASRFEEPTFQIIVAHRILDITSHPWGDWVVQSGGN